MFGWWKSRKELKTQIEFIEADRQWARSQMHRYHDRLCDECAAHSKTTQKLSAVNKRLNKLYEVKESLLIGAKFAGNEPSKNSQVLIAELAELDVTLKGQVVDTSA
ncbi:hypothetical protein KAR91_11820 [Candidatus Pacearchaeota archaeon]|nr:hypothetical protein [Candidatus Pacearchaeota archaeon]